MQFGEAAGHLNFERILRDFDDLCFRIIMA